MRPLLTALLLVSTLSGVAFAEIPAYYERYRFLAAPPATFDDGLVGFANPANLALLGAPEARFYWSSDLQQMKGFRNWGLYTGLPYLGFSAQGQRSGDAYVTDYRLGLGLGSRAGGVGIAYGWSGGDADSLAGEKQITLSLIGRPARYLSLGLTGNLGLTSSAYEWVGEVGVRPLGSPLLTLFADAAWQKDVAVDDVPWSAGAAVRLFSGVNVVGRYFKAEAFTIGLTLNFGRSGLFSQSHFDDAQEFAYQTYAIRTGGLRDGLKTSRLSRGRYYVTLQPRGRLRYLKFAFFDERSSRYFELLNDIRRAAEDPRVAAVALSLSGVRMSPEVAWEVREEIKVAQAKSKKVIVYIDQAGMTQYHLASVADYVVMDPVGSVILDGYVLNRTYFKGSLGKLGLAFDEWRYFKYKSAAEALSRTDMSAADREQRQAYVDDWYELTQSDVVASRSVTPAQFDAWINNRVLFTSDSALAAGLVDTLARWSDLGRIMSRVVGHGLRPLGSDGVLANAMKPLNWGTPPRIALVYAIGPCAMETGIRARWLEHTLLNLARDRSVRAVVLRVDSPGGDGLASDLVSEAMKKCAQVKPVIISQGQVAASGGYWISMQGTKIVAGPNTVTGSIGVIGGWLYDDGFGEKYGMTADHVQRGAHADYRAGVRLPLLGLTVPSRNLTEDEEALVEEAIKDFYYLFVNKVARARSMAVNEVSELGEGRIYSGVDAEQNELIDEIGNLFAALTLARQNARIRSHEEVEIVEYPSRRGLFNWPWREYPGLETASEDPWVTYIRMLSESRGRPLPLLLPGSYPEAD
jgi:protease-4